MSTNVTKPRPYAFTVIRAPAAGFYVGEKGGPNEYSPILAAFTTLDEALSFIRKEMAEESA